MMDQFSDIWFLPREINLRKGLNPSIWVDRKLNIGFSSYFAKLFDDFSKFCSVFGAAIVPLSLNKSAKNEEKPFSTWERHGSNSNLTHYSWTLPKLEN